MHPGCSLTAVTCCRWSPAEKREIIRRRLLLLFYLLRSPFFDLYTRCAPGLHHILAERLLRGCSVG